VDTGIPALAYALAKGEPPAFEWTMAYAPRDTLGPLWRNAAKVPHPDPYGCFIVAGAMRGLAGARAAGLAAARAYLGPGSGPERALLQATAPTEESLRATVAHYRSARWADFSRGYGTALFHFVEHLALYVHRPPGADAVHIFLDTMMRDADRRAWSYHADRVWVETGSSENVEHLVSRRVVRAITRAVKPTSVTALLAELPTIHTWLSGR